MAKKRKKSQPVNMKNKSSTIIIDGMDIFKHSSAGYNPTPFKTGKYMTEKDRPRDKSYKRDY